MQLKLDQTSSKINHQFRHQSRFDDCFYFWFQVWFLSSFSNYYNSKLIILNMKQRQSEFCWMFDLLTQIEDKFDQAPFELVAGLLSLRMFWRKEAMKSISNGNLNSNWALDSNVTQPAFIQLILIQLQFN